MNIRERAMGKTGKIPEIKCLDCFQPAGSPQAAEIIKHPVKRKEYRVPTAAPVSRGCFQIIAAIFCSLSIDFLNPSCIRLLGLTVRGSQI